MTLHMSVGQKICELPGTLILKHIRHESASPVTSPTDLIGRHDGSAP